MSSSIWTYSTHIPSIFSRADTCSSAATQWTAEASEKLEHEGDRVRHDGPQKHNKRIGRPPNKWTRERLRKLIRLYLLTDLELNGIIHSLRTEDFQPCKRNVQEKLGQLLQPQPRTIRPKSDSKVLRNLLLECSRLQKTRKIEKQRRRGRLEHKGNSHTEDIIVPRPEQVGGETTYHGKASYTADAATSPPNSIDHGVHSLGTVSFGMNASKSWAHEDTRIQCPSMPSFDFGIPTTDSIAPFSSLPTPSYDRQLQNPGFQSQVSENDSCENNLSYSISHSIGLSRLYQYDNDFPDHSPDFGFGSDFELLPFQPSLEIRSVPSISGTVNNVIPEIETNLETQYSKAILPAQLVPPPSAFISTPKRPVVNPTYMRDAVENAWSFWSADESLHGLDTTYEHIARSDACYPTSIGDHKEAGHASSAGSLSEFEDETSNRKHKRISDPLSSISKLSTLLSKMSLTPPSTPSSAHESTVLSSMFACPVVLPGVFPEYCWQHINRNTLRRCPTASHGLQKCDSKRHSKSKPTHRSLRADVLARIVQRNIRKLDIHEIDTFGNSILHISATMLASSTYLVSLIMLGADVNRLNNAGQTFLHLVKPELLNDCADFCSLLEILSAQGFNFSQHDHLGQSPLHLLLRPWIQSDILRQLITKLELLQIHDRLSTARDCLGYTIIEEMNLQETSSSWEDVDQAILSLACETKTPIANPQDLQIAKEKARHNESMAIDDQLARNYENHPSIETVDDLLQYEQHVDYWRTIVAAKASPWFEDLNGRNGLHCLAESCLASRDKPLPDLLLAQLDFLGRAGHSDESSGRQCFVNSLLSSGVDPNNYDKEGNTPLMAFIVHLREAEDDDASTKILNSILKAGGEISRRNRQGETALHLAVKLGRRAATEVLLAAGANVHARTGNGMGVLELGQQHAKDSKEDSRLFAQIMLCITLAASFGAVAKPTILDEWGSQWKIPSDSRQKRKGFNAVKSFIVKKARGRRSPLS